MSFELLFFRYFEGTCDYRAEDYVYQEFDDKVYADKSGEDIDEDIRASCPCFQSFGIEKSHGKAENSGVYNGSGRRRDDYSGNAVFLCDKAIKKSCDKACGNAFNKAESYCQNWICGKEHCSAEIKTYNAADRSYNSENAAEKRSAGGSVKSRSDNNWNENEGDADIRFNDITEELQNNDDNRQNRGRYKFAGCKTVVFSHNIFSFCIKSYGKDGVDMGFEPIFLAILFSVFFIFSKKERKAKIAANTVSGLVCLILFNLFAPIKPGFGFFPITMASLLGVPAVLAMVVVKIS